MKRRGSTPIIVRMPKRHAVFLVALALTASVGGTAGGAAGTVSPWRVAAHNVLAARPAAEVYWTTHGNSYLGMTTAKLAAIGGAYGGPIHARVVWATRANYCLQSTVGAVAAHGMSVAHSTGALRGPWPRRP